VIVATPVGFYQLRGISGVSQTAEIDDDTYTNQTGKFYKSNSSR
jgi:hypothetical protein